MSGRLSQKEKPALGRISRYKTTQVTKPRGLINLFRDKIQEVSDTTVEQIRSDPKSVVRKLPGAVKTVAKAAGRLALNMPNYVVGGMVGVGRSVMEETLPRIYPTVSRESLRKQFSRSKSTDEYLLKGEVPTWQQVKEGVDKYTEQSPDALPLEKKYLGTGLAVAGFAADSFFGGPGKKVAKEAIEEIAKTTEVSKIASLVKNDLPGLTEKQHSILANVLKDVDDPKKVETILDKATFLSEQKLRPKGRLSKQLPEVPVTKRTGLDLQKELGSKKISPELQKVELEAFDKVAKEGVEKMADDLIKTNGNIVSTDRAKSLFPTYKANKTLSDGIQKPARLVSDAAYEKLLKTQKGKGIVSIFGGGTGAGKSVAINKGLADSAVIYEANLPNFNSAVERVDKALAEGYEVELTYVYRDPYDAFDAGVLNRERTVTIDGHLGTHLPIPKTVLELLKHYRNNEKVTVRVLDNSRGKELSTIIDDPIDFFSNKMYSKEYEDSLRNKLSDSLERAYTEKRINEDTYTRTKGTRTDDSRYTQPQPKGRSEDRIDPETESLELLASQVDQSEYALRGSIREEDRIVSNLEAIFADLKGVSLEDLKVKFTEEDLNNAELNYQFAMESLLDDPARALSKYANKRGVLPQVTGTEFVRSSKNSEIKIKNSRFGREGDSIVTELGFKSSEEAREAYLSYVKRKEELTTVLDNLREIRRNINLAKQKDNFVDKEKNKLARELATNIKGLQAIVQAAERAGFRKGIKEGGKKYTELVSRLRERRKRITAIKVANNLTDGEMKKILSDKDPRFMTADEFERFADGVQKGAEARLKTNQERLLVEAIIEERGLKKVENLQKAMQFPRIQNMTRAQLEEFGSILSKTDYGDTFLGPRMIQTAVNTDLGEIKTLGDGRRKIVEQTGMPFSMEVEGSKVDRWLRDPTLVEKDPLHKMFVTEWTAKEADMLTRQYALQEKLNTLATASRKSRPRTIGDRVAPQDEMAVKYAETLPENLPRLEKDMTPEEIEFGKFLRGFFEKYYQYVQEDAAQRWTLQGVKYSRFKDMYFPHMSRGFFERWKDDGFVRAVKILWDTNVADTKIDFNAFGDRGEVLGYEKWFKNNMKREAEKGAYTKNAASTAISYFNAFERKLLLDSMIPKIKLLEFLVGKKMQTPKSINNPEGAEKTHSLLTKSINEWINNKKGQRVEMLYAQGDKAESAVDAASMFVSMVDLGANIAIQVGSGVGGAVVSARGAGLPKYAIGVKRALTKQGRKLSRENRGIIGVSPWFELSNVANDAGDTLRSALFSGFGDLAYRARRQMFLGLLTKEEFTSGVISSKRVAEIKLQIGKWHPMPEFDSVAGSTSLVSAAGKYTSWATPIFQTAMKDLGDLKNEMRRLAGTKDFNSFIKSSGFKNTLHTVSLGIGAYALGQMVFRPEEEERDTFIGNIKYIAARESGTLIQGMTGIGVFSSGRMLGFVQDLYEIGILLLTMERYAKDGEGYEEGDLKAVNKLYKTLVPKSIRQFIPEEEAKPKTAADINAEILEQVESGKLTVKAAKEQYVKEMKNLQESDKKRRFKLTQDEYKKDLLARIESKEISVAKAKEEFTDYIKEQKKYAPESFESNSDSDFIGKIQIAAKAIGTDPVTLFQAIFTDEEIRRMDNGEIILYRGKTSDPQEQKQFSIDERKERKATDKLILDHTIPLQLGGDNSDSNLRLVLKEEWEEFTPVENFLGQALRREEISADEAQDLIASFKSGEISAEEVYSSVE